MFYLRRSLSLFAGCVFALFSFVLQAQTVVYADLVKGDSTDIAVKDLFKELGKAGFGKYNVRPLADYNGTGLVFVQARKKASSHVHVPAKLATYGPEGIYIRGDQKSMIIAGNTALALQEAVFLYLEELGFRYLAPGNVWEEIPSLTTLYKPVNILTQPDFVYRGITNGHGFSTKKKMETEFYDWAKANRLGGAFEIRVGHAYDEIVGRNATAFKEHPEYFAQPVARGTIPDNPKFNVANKDLVQLVVKDAFSRLEEFRNRGVHTNMISMEPSDGGGFCTTPACKKIGGPSEQAYYLTNAVIRELRKKIPHIWAGTLAYNEHISPPDFRIEPGVFVMLTTAFNNSGLSTEQLLKKWNQKVAIAGIYDYLSVYEWDFDLPGQVTSAHITSNQRRLQRFYDAGARAYLGESTMGWVTRGPGQFILARVLWNRNADVETIRTDFFEKGYGNVAGIIRNLYDNWDNYPHQQVMNNDLANWMTWVDEAYNKASSNKIKERINHLKKYLHYLVLYRNIKANPTESNLQELLKYAYRELEREQAPFAVLPVLVSLPNYTGFPSLGFYASGQQNYKQANISSGDADVQSVFQQDIRSVKKTADVSNFPLADAFIKLNSVAPSLKKLQFSQTEHAYWGPTEFVIRIVKKDTGNWIDLLSNIAKVGDQRPVEISIYPYTKKTALPGSMTPLLQFNQTQGEVFKRYSLSSLKPGYYTMRVRDPMKMFILNFSSRIEYSIVMNPREKLLTTTAAGINKFLIYVPEGVKNFRVTKTVIVKLQSPTGREIDHGNSKDEVFDVDVREGEHGVWMVFYQSGRLFIEGIPPYLGTSHSQMLVPSYLKK